MAEQKEREEKKKIIELQRRLEEERQQEELERLHEEHNPDAPKKKRRLEWMYQGPAEQEAEKREAYLLGERLREAPEAPALNDKNQLAAGSSSLSNPQGRSSEPINYSDLKSKIRNDPLFAMKKLEMQGIKKVLDNPMLMSDLKRKTKSQERERERSKHQHSGKTDVRRDHTDRERAGHLAERSEDRSAPPQNRDRERDWERERSDRRRSYEQRPRNGYPHHDEDRRPAGSYSQSSRDNRDYQRQGQHVVKDRFGRTRDVERDLHRRGPSSAHSRSGTAPSAPQRASKEEERQRKLAAMMQDAQEHEDQVKRRLEERLAREKADEQRDEAMRVQTKSSGAFLQETAQSVASSMDLKERLKRNAFYLEKKHQM
jgi:hypothetical protein